MTPLATEFLAKQAEQFTTFRKALTVESDRGCAPFAAAYLDKALSDLLHASLVENKKIEEDLFNSQGPLAAFFLLESSLRITLERYPRQNVAT